MIVYQRLIVPQCSIRERPKSARSRRLSHIHLVAVGTKHPPQEPKTHDGPYRLSARFVATIEQPGRYGDGRGSGGHSLLVKHTTRGHLAKSWAQRISVDGRQRNLGLGSRPHVSLAEAREKCALNLAARRRGELMTGRKRTVPTFEEAVEKVIAVHRAGWKDGSKSEKDWRATLRDYAVPKLGGRPVHRINTADVMAVLLPTWNEKRVTARWVRQRIGAVMRWAVAHG